MKTLNISIDDVSPHPKSSTKVLRQCFKLVDIYPKIKFTLFVPTAYWRTVKSSISTKKPLILTDFPDFCDELKKLPKQNFEIGYHGHYHGIPGKNDNDEFARLSYKDALEKFKLMISTVEDVGLEKKFSPLFRPPAWKMSPDSFRASFDSGISHLAIFPISFNKKYGWTQATTYQGEDKLDKYHTSYASCFPPFKSLNLETQTNIVYHACEWDRNYLSDSLLTQLKTFLSEHKSEFKFSFLQKT